MLKTITSMQMKQFVIFLITNIKYSAVFFGYAANGPSFCPSGYWICLYTWVFKLFVGQLLLAKGDGEQAFNAFKIVLDGDRDNVPALLGQVLEYIFQVYLMIDCSVDCVSLLALGVYILSPYHTYSIS